LPPEYNNSTIGVPFVNSSLRRDRNRRAVPIQIKLDIRRDVKKSGAGLRRPRTTDLSSFETWNGRRTKSIKPLQGSILVVHVTHAAAMTAGHRSFLLLFRDFGDEAFGGEEQTSDRSRVLQRGAGD